MKNKLAREIIFTSVVIMFIIISILLFLFLTGGQIDGINYDPEMVLQSTAEPNVNGLSWEVIVEDIEAIDDGTEITNVELWQFFPRDILLFRVIYYLGLSLNLLLIFHLPSPTYSL